MRLANQTKAFIYASLTVLAWSTVSTAFKIALRQLTPWQLIYVSMGVASVFLILTLLIKDELRALVSLPIRGWLKGTVLGVMLYIYYGVLFLAYERLPAQIAQPINNTWGIVLALLAAVFMRQKLSGREFFWMCFAYVGVLIITVGSTAHMESPSPLGLVLIVTSTFLYAAYWIVNAKSGLPPAQSLAICFIVSFILAFITLLWLGEPLVFPLVPFLGGAYVGLFELAVPFLLWGMAMRLTSSVARISSLPFLGPFLALFWISLVLGETIAWTTVLGLVFIVTGTFMQQRVASARSAQSMQDSK